MRAISILYKASEWPHETETETPHFESNQLNLWFQVLAQAVQDIKVGRSAWHRQDVDTTQAFKRGSLDHIAEMLLIDPEYMRDVLKKLNLL